MNGGGGVKFPPKNDIICTTVFVRYPHEVFGILSLTKTVLSTKQLSVAGLHR